MPSEAFQSTKKTLALSLSSTLEPAVSRVSMRGGGRRWPPTLRSSGVADLRSHFELLPEQPNAGYCSVARGPNGRFVSPGNGEQPSAINGGSSSQANDGGAATEMLDDGMGGHDSSDAMDDASLQQAETLQPSVEAQPREVNPCAVDCTGINDSRGASSLVDDVPGGGMSIDGAVNVTNAVDQYGTVHGTQGVRGNDCTKIPAQTATSSAWSKLGFFALPSLKDLQHLSPKNGVAQLDVEEGWGRLISTSSRPHWLINCLVNIFCFTIYKLSKKDDGIGLGLSSSSL